MKHKALDVNKFLKIVGKELRKSKDDLNKVVRVKTFVRETFMDLVDYEINKIWIDGKMKNQNKAKNLSKKFGNEEETINVYDGVYVGDE